jgi:hypothetical protein
VKRARGANQLGLFRSTERQGDGQIPSPCASVPLRVTIVSPHPHLTSGVVRAFSQQTELWGQYSEVRFVLASPRSLPAPLNRGKKVSAGENDNTFSLGRIVSAAKKDLWSAPRAERSIGIPLTLSVRFGLCAHDTEPPGRSLLAIQAVAAIAFEGATYVGLSPAIAAPPRMVQEFLTQVEPSATIESFSKWLDIAVPGNGNHWLSEYASTATMSALCPILQRDGYRLPDGT